MSNIYVLEPPTDGKVLLKTTVGDIEIELWSREAPKACRNFVQLCMEGYYDGTIFHRVVKDFVVQGGDPGGDGSSAGESIYGKPFNDEFHSRLRFVRRGLVAMANSGKNDNTSHFFFTLAACPELNNKNTIFGRVGGDTIFNMLKLGECDTDSSDRPLYPHNIKRTKIISNPFNDIVPRVSKKTQEAQRLEEQSKIKQKKVKNFSLLSFGDEAREDEEEAIRAAETFQNKSKSSHDLLDDKNLSSIPAVRMDDPEDDDDVDDEIIEKAGEDVSMMTVDSVRAKLKRKSDNKRMNVSEDKNDFVEIKLSNTSEERIKKYKEEAKELMRELKGRKGSKLEGEKKPPKLVRNLDMFKRRPASSAGRKNNSETLDILNKFKKKIQAASRLTEYDSGEEEINEEADKEEEEEDDNTTNKDISWMTHKFVCPVDVAKVLDANIKELDRYEIYDPRNPMTQRRKKESANKMKKPTTPFHLTTRSHNATGDKAREEEWTTVYPVPTPILEFYPRGPQTTRCRKMRGHHTQDLAPAGFSRSL